MKNYCSKWNLQINEAKTKVSMFGTNYTYQFHCNLLPLEVVDLGLWISKRNLKKDIHHVIISCQSKNIIFVLKQCIIKLQTPPVSVALHLFNSIIKPIFCYGCEIWGFTVKEEIERIEVQYLKYILHFPKNATNSAVCGSLGKFLSIYFGKKTLSSISRFLSRKIFFGGKLVLRTVLVAPGGGYGRGVCPLPCETWKLSPF